ncbi:MAG: DUF5895 domain-containing protein [Leptolyngbyaceae cyanobacterium bins.59]|nr:DUF5895 domain-containing protein [Leptolyngbyaceae cyanobacterium bins.59]
MAHLRTSKTIPQSRTTPSERDEFDSEQFESGRESLPYLQMLNHQDPNQSGFFITSENMEAVEFNPDEEWTFHTTTFQNGETVVGFRSLIARLLILRKSKLLMFDRDSGEFLGPFQKSRYDRNTIVLKTRYLVFLISKGKQLLHNSPLLLTAKGSFNGSFGEVVRKFQGEMSKAYGAATGAKKPRGDRFLALSILAVRVKPQLKGEHKRSWACSVDSYGSPSVNNWKSYFVGYTPDLKEKILSAFDQWEGFGSIEQEIEAQQQSLPKTTSSQGNSDGDEVYDTFNNDDF